MKSSVATDCKVVIAQTTIQCKTQAGIGAGHSWTITRGDQQAANASTFLTSYAVPSITDISGDSKSQGVVHPATD